MEYCDGCTHLYPTEEEQNKTHSNGMPHICNVRAQRVRHMGHHPHIVRIDGCKDYKNENGGWDMGQVDITNISGLKTQVEQRLFNTSPVVRKGLELYLYKGLPYENALLMIIIALSEQSDEYFRHLVELTKHMPLTLLFTRES